MGMNFFMEIAKLRAARLLWSELMAEFEPKDPRSSMLRTHCQTSGVSLTASDPYNNVVRTTVEALAAVLGGTQSLHTNALDEALGLPTPFSARIARNTQLILAEETGITHVADPLGGSFYIESLTQSLADEARKLIAEVEELGGMTRAVEAGLPQRQIERSAASKQARIDRGEETVVGVNKYRPDEADQVDILEVDNSEVREIQIARLERLREARDEAALGATLQALAAAARAGDGNLLELSIEAVRARATVGEVSQTLGEVFTRHRATIGSISGVYGRGLRGRRGLPGHPPAGGGLRREERAPAAHAGGQDGPGRARPGSQGHRHGLRRHRLRGGLGRPLPDAAGSRPGSLGKRRPRHRRPPPRQAATRPWCRP